MEESENENFLENADNILKNYRFYIENTINNIVSNRAPLGRVKVSELKTKLKNLGFTSNNLDNYISKYESNMYIDFGWEQEETSETVSETTVDNNNNNDDFEIDLAKLDNIPAHLDDLSDNDINDINIDNLIFPDEIIFP